MPKISVDLFRKNKPDKSKAGCRFVKKFSHSTQFSTSSIQTHPKRKHRNPYKQFENNKGINVQKIFAIIKKKSNPDS